MIQHIDLLGTPYLENGRVGDAGIDCYGLLIEMMRRAGTPIPDIYNPEGGQTACARVFAQNLDAWHPCEPKAGCAVLIRIGRHNSHCGFLLDPFTMIHTWEGAGGVVVEKLNAWRQRIVGFYEFAGTQ
ncbi:NlpC/P60 family protein [Chromobacterium sp. ASV23]|uniref:NlpC/P60 family protein n=1 Tax=Chromobacterium sp. ASV23 TaxID=2795110 RepID=UPI0018EA3DFA|nr:NlpC/P60 family protein [Chromobacterium sp. ASV23]